MTAPKTQFRSVGYQDADGTYRVRQEPISEEKPAPPAPLEPAPLEPVTPAPLRPLGSRGRS